MKLSADSNQNIVYIFSLIASVIVLPATLISIRLIIRCWRSRQLQSNLPQIIQLSTRLNSDHSHSDESVIFQATELYTAVGA